MAELLDLKTIEGRFSPHDAFLRSQLKLRKDCFRSVSDPAGMAEYVGGVLEAPRSDEKWSISKEIFPGIRIHAFYRSDEEFGNALEAYFSGERVRDMPGEDLAELAVATVNQMIRYVRSVTPADDLPEVCRRI